MSDVSQGPGWWQASDGKWYPPKESEQPPAPGWWLAADGKWYPPVEVEQAPRPGWWLAADGKWYPPVESAPPVLVSPPVFEPTPIEIDQLPPAPEPVPAPAPEPEPEPDPQPGPEPVLESSPPSPAAPSPPAPAAPSARPPRSIEQASSRAAARNPRPANPADQIRQRDAASRQDAIAQAPARFLAASRALKLLADVDDEPAELTAPATTPATTPAAAPAGLAHAPETAPHPAEPKSTAAARSAARAAQADAEAGPAPSSPAGSPAPPPAAPLAPPVVNGEHLLIELRTSPLGAEIDHLGDRLLVFGDRVELRDRNDRVRQALAGDDITDVVIQRKFTGAVLSVESATGEPIVTRGIKPEQADEARVLIHQHTRQGRPPAGQLAADVAVSAAPEVQAPGTAPSSDAVAAAAARLAILNRDRLNEADLLRKLADLHRAGVLTDAEFESKIALVGRLVSGESLAIS